MILTREQVQAAYTKAGGNTMTTHQNDQAKRFIENIFDLLEQVGYDDTDFQPMYKRPEFES